MTAEQLVKIYINKAGKVNSQFTRQMHKASDEIREETIALIAAHGLPAYTMKPPKVKHPRVGVIKLKTLEQERKSVITFDMLHELLAEVRRERSSIADRLKTLDAVDRYYMERLRVMQPTDDLTEAPDQTDYQEAHEHSKNNKSEISRSEKCGCFYCCEIFAPSEITRWLDDYRNNRQRFTATCPRCGVDAVIGDKSGYMLSEQFLKGMSERWFKPSFTEDSRTRIRDASAESQNVSPVVGATDHAVQL